jgi:hypothetical protein
MLKNVVERGWPQLKIRHMRIACWIPKATDTHSEYVILIAFPLQQWLYEGASLLWYTVRTVHRLSKLKQQYGCHANIVFSYKSGRRQLMNQKVISGNIM